MKLTRLADYAVRAIVHLATKKEGEMATIAEIAESQGIPSSFLAKVMQALSRGGIVRAHRGKSGGFSLVDEPEKVTIRMIVEAVEGPINLNRCLTKPGECDRDTFCGAHPVWREAQEALFSVLDKYTAAEMAKSQLENIKKQDS
ncbi:MAG: Rrf2 family transcriptional regulator [Deltaproteobacteria bacterium]|nr:Rrf2 family transcriptional regulator [Deltaproteobacteria bacterium]